MKLGTNHEVRVTTPNPATAEDLFLRFGFLPMEDDSNLLTDGSLYIRFVAGDTAAPKWFYYESDPSELQAAGIPVSTSNGERTVTSPEGFTVVLSNEKSPAPPLEGTPLERKPLSRLGKFGEFTLPTKDFTASQAFWEKLGFSSPMTMSEPYPWGIFTDGLIILGLHQTEEIPGPMMAYFSSDAPARIAALEADQLPITRIPNPGGEGDIGIVNAPGGLTIMLAQGEI